MKKISAVCMALMCMVTMATTVSASSNDVTLNYDITSYESHDVTVPAGSTITVTFRIDSEDATALYDVYAIQNEIYWDDAFFQLVDDSFKMEIQGSGSNHISSTRNNYAYFNSLTTASYDLPQTIGTFQLKVRDDAGLQTGDYTWLRSTSNFAYGTDMERFASNAKDTTLDMSDAKWVTPLANTQVLADEDLRVEIGPHTQYNLNFVTNDGTAVAPVTANQGTTVDLTDYTTTRNGYTFHGWYLDQALTQKVAEVTLHGDVTVYASWSKNTSFFDITLIAEGNGTITPDANNDGVEHVGIGASRTFYFTPAEGYIVEDVLVDGDSVGPVSSYKISDVTSSREIHVIFTEGDNSGDVSLNRADHFAYMKGCPGQTFRATANITRAETVVMFSRLVTESMDMDKTYTSSFSDVTSDLWYANAVGYMEQYGIISGYVDGTFRGDETITRAEFAAIASRFDDLIGVDENKFSDIDEDYWACGYINSASEKGWITGYEDGTFKPTQNIIRSEAVALVNRVLGRICDQDFVDSCEDITVFVDLTESYWAYYQIMEATNGHDYDRNADGTETWTKLH